MFPCQHYAIYGMFPCQHYAIYGMFPGQHYAIYGMFPCQHYAIYGMLCLATVDEMETCLDGQISAQDKMSPLDLHATVWLVVTGNL